MKLSKLNNGKWVCIIRWNNEEFCGISEDRHIAFELATDLVMRALTGGQAHEFDA